MTANMRNAAEQAAFDLGRAMAKYEMTADISSAIVAPGFAPVMPNANSHRKRGRVAKGSVTKSVAPKAAKATKVRGTRKATGPRAKGVKEGIMNLLKDQGSDGVSIEDIIRLTGYKKTSVRATMMGLEKKNIARQDDKLWVLNKGTIIGSGQKISPDNSETEHAHANF